MEIMDWVREYYGKEYAPNTRETLRSQTLQQFVDSGLVVKNPDDPYRPATSARNCFQVERRAFALAGSYGAAKFQEKLKIYLTEASTPQFQASTQSVERSSLVAPRSEAASDKTTTANHFSGEATNVMQAGTVNGDISYHSPSRSFVELYQKAVDHLASDKAYTRMAGLRSLVALGQNYIENRQMLADELCGYLRIPNESADPGEAQVRRTAQQLLAECIRPHRGKDGNPTNLAYWPKINVDLSGAKLTDANFAYCEFLNANFDETSFPGTTWFTGARFLSEARFVGAVFDGPWVSFEGTSFEDVTWFRWVAFHAAAEFRNARFSVNAEFSRAYFSEVADFRGMKVEECGWFTHNKFRDKVVFCESSFKLANFIEVDFEGGVDFRNAEFSTRPGCIEVRFQQELKGRGRYHWPPGWRPALSEQAMDAAGRLWTGVLADNDS